MKDHPSIGALIDWARFALDVNLTPVARAMAVQLLLNETLELRAALEARLLVEEAMKKSLPGEQEEGAPC